MQKQNYVIYIRKIISKAYIFLKKNADGNFIQVGYMF